MWSLYIRGFAKAWLRGVVRFFGYDIGRDLGRDLAADVGRLSGGDPLAVIADVGAHIGQSAAYFRKAFPQAHVFSFEPDPHSFEELSRRCAGLTGVTPVRAAAGSHQGEARLYLKKARSTNSLLATAAAAARYGYGEILQEAGSLPVPVCRLDDFFAAQRIARIDLLKMDVQGGELEVLKGAGRLLDSGSVRFVLTELLFIPLYQEQAFYTEICQFLRERNFQLVNLYHHAFVDSYLAWCDALFVHRPDS